MANVKVGFIFSGKADDFGWNFNLNAGRLALETHFFGSVSSVVVEDVSDWGSNECDFCSSEFGWDSQKGSGGGWNNEPSLFKGTHACSMIVKKMIDEQNVDVVIATSFYFQWDVYHMAIKYPTKYFVQVGGDVISARPNLATVSPKAYQSRYLSGITMAWYLKKSALPKKVGFVSSYVLGETVRHINAFKLGLEAVDPQIEVMVIFVQSWESERRMEIATKQLIEYYGVEGIAQHVDSNKPLRIAKAYGKVGAGYSTDMQYMVGENVLTSDILNWGPAFIDLVEKVRSGGSGFAGDRWGGYADGWVRLAAFSQIVPLEAKAPVDAAVSNLNSGIDQIFCKPNLKDNKGRFRNTVGQANPAENPVAAEATHLQTGTSCLTDAVIRQSCQKYVANECVEHWLLEGIHDTCGQVSSSSVPGGACLLGNLDIPDRCPAGKHLSLIGCTSSSRGFYAVNEQEIPCPAGYQAPNEGLSACLPCQPGSAGNFSNMTSCTPCDIGHYADEASMQLCKPCPAGTFASATGASSCQPCAQGAYSALQGSSACTVCPSTRPTTMYRGSTASTECTCLEDTFLKDGTCQPCPEGMVCSGYDAAPELLPGYWATPSKPFETMLCKSTAYCPGGQVTSDVCGLGHVGLVCEICPSNQYKDFGSGECMQCGAVSRTPMVLFIIFCICIPLVLHRFFSYSNVRRSASDSLVCAMMLGQLAAYAQIFAILGALNVDWPAAVAWFLSLIQVFALQFDLLMPSCLFEWNYLLETFVGILIPWMFVTVYGIQILGSYALGRLQIIRSLGRGLDLVVASCIVGRVFLVFQVAILKQTTKTFECYGHPNGDKSLVEFPHVKCYESDHVVILPFAVIMMFFYVIVVTSYLCYVVWVAPRRFREKSFFQRHSFLMLKFRPDRWYWSVPVYLRNTVLCLVVSFVPDYPAMQVICFNFIVGSFMSFVLFLEPWRDQRNNMTEFTLSLLLTIFSLATLPLLPRDETLIGPLTVIMIIALTFEGLVILYVVSKMSATKSFCNCIFGRCFLWRGGDQRVQPDEESYVDEQLPAEEEEANSMEGKFSVRSKASFASSARSQKSTRSQASSQSAQREEVSRNTVALQEMCRTVAQMELRRVFDFLSFISVYDQRLISSWMRLVTTELNLTEADTHPAAMQQSGGGGRLKEPLDDVSQARIRKESPGDWDVRPVSNSTDPRADAKGPEAEGVEVEPS